jgi:hypothetical protein
MSTLIVSGSTKEQKTEEKGFILPESKATTIIIPSGTVLREGMERIDKMERNSKNHSDPFAFQRMRTHFKL